MMIALVACVLAMGPLDPPSNVRMVMDPADGRIGLSPSPEAPGIVISAPGSYFLTGNVIGTAANHGIAISANNVTLDLRGFSVIGVPGSLDGITLTAANRVNITIHGGTVRGWGQDGIDLSNAVNACLGDVQSVGNGGDGILMRGGQLSKVQSRANGGSGVVASGNLIISNSYIESNSTHGISATGGVLITNSTIGSNAAKGVELGSGSVIRDSIISGNTLAGVDADGPGTLIANNLIRGNSGHGITIGDQVTVMNNVLNGNGGITNSNIFINADRNHVEGNTISIGAFGIRGGGGADFNLIGRNSVFNCTTGYDVGITNFTGTITSNPATVGIWGNFNF